MKSRLWIVGVILIVVGLLWTGQGLGWIGHGGMSGDSTWAIIGPVVALAGAGLIALGGRGRAR